METTKGQVPDEHRQPLRRRYEEAFDHSTGNEEEEHIVPQPTIPLGTDEEETQRDEEASSLSKVSCDVPFCCMTFESVKEYQKHYDSRHMYSCSVCRVSLPSAHILELHVLEIHDTLFSLMAEKKPMYNCFIETCTEKFLNQDVRKEHCMEQHKFPIKFRFWDCKPPKNHQNSGKNNKNAGNSKSKPKKVTPKISSEDVDMKINVSCSDSVIEDSDKDKSNSKQSQQNKGSSVPKHKNINISFGHASHRTFKNNAYAAAIAPKNNKAVVKNDSNNIDMKDIEEALVTSSK